MNKPDRLRPQVVLLGIASLLNDAASELIYPLLPIFLTTVLGASPAAIGLIEGAADGLASILKYVAGWWSDKVNKRKPLIVGGYALAAISRIIIAVASTWHVVLAARLLDRTGKGARSAPRDAMISDVTPPAQRGRAFGFHRALDHTGAIVGPLLAILLLDALHWPLRKTFMFAIVPGAIGVLMLTVLLKDRPKPEPEEVIDRDVSAPPAPAAKLGSQFLRAITVISLFSLANSSDAFLLLQAHNAGVSTAMLPLLWAAHHVIKSLFSTRAGAFSDRAGRRRMLAAGWASYAVIYAVFPYASSLAFFVTLFVLYAIPFTLAEGAERAWIADLVAPELRGKSFGVYYLANGLCVLAGTALFGVIYQTFSHRAAFYTSGALAAAAALLVMTPFAPRRREA